MTVTRLDYYGRIITENDKVKFKWDDNSPPKIGIVKRVAATGAIRVDSENVTYYIPVGSNLEVI